MERYLQQPLIAADVRQQAREAGALDAQVFSLQARRALLLSLDLIPPQYTYTAGSVEVPAAAKGTAEPEAAPLPPSHPPRGKHPRHASCSQPAASCPSKVRSASTTQGIWRYWKQRWPKILDLTVHD
jgi:hypothetical protein